MKLTEEQWFELSEIFHDKYDEVDSLNQLPAASFLAVVDIVETFLGAPNRTLYETIDMSINRYQGPGAQNDEE